MNNALREDLFDVVLASAFADYIDMEAKAMPSKEELDRLYPIPKNGLRRLKREIKKKNRGSRAAVYLRRIAVIFLVAVTLFAGVMSFSAEVRSSVINAIIEVFDEFISISFAEGAPASSASTADDAKALSIGYIPEGFVLEEYSEFNREISYTYTAPGDKQIIISISASGTAKYSFDTEHFEREMIFINDSEGYVFYDADENTGCMLFKAKDRVVMLNCNILDKNEMLKIAKNIK